MGYDSMYAATPTDDRLAGGGAGVAPRPDAHPGGAGPGGDGVPGGRRLGRARDRRPFGIQPGDGAPAPEALPRDRRGRVAPPPAGTAARHGAPRAGGGGARCLAGPRPHVDGGPSGGRARRGVRHRVESSPDAQVPGPRRGVAPHGAHAQAQAGPGQGRAGESRARLAQKKAAAGRIRLVYLDECGFSPSQPVTYTWVRRRERKRIPYENPEGRRVNALAALLNAGAAPALYWVAKPGSLRASHL